MKLLKKGNIKKSNYYINFIKNKFHIINRLNFNIYIILLAFPHYKNQNRNIYSYCTHVCTYIITPKFSIFFIL